jgi:transcriptional regulator with XRE-family HTH domain
MLHNNGPRKISMAKKTVKAVDSHVGALVRKRRMALGMSQAKLGDAIGLTFQQVQKYEKGANRISSSRLVQIANVLDVPPTFFFEGAPSALRGPAKKQDSMDDISEFVASKDGGALMKAFVNLPKDIQHILVKLVEKIAANE